MVGREGGKESRESNGKGRTDKVKYTHSHDTWRNPFENRH
jgi:hypothetical protein